MDFDEFFLKGNERRLAREAKELRRAERTAMIVLWVSAALAFFIVLQAVWGWMA